MTLKSDLFLRIIRKLVSFWGFSSKIQHDYTFTGEKSSEFIEKSILSGKPFLVARIGATEFKCISGFMNESEPLKKYIDFTLNKTDTLSIDEDVINQAYTWSGIFPAEKSVIEQFSALSLNDIKDIDVLGIWLKEEYLLKQQLKGKIKIPLSDIEPYYHKNPWSASLEGKNVLVVHPFAKTIENQYQKRLELFENQAILPTFNLTVLQSVQSIAGQKTPFTSWFEALDHMKFQMDQIDYDIAIIGCGAYGLSLGAHAKRMGKQAIHLGGATQILFGIKGSRWDNHPVISGLYNDSWVRPSLSETPMNKNEVEEGCYW